MKRVLFLLLFLAIMIPINQASSQTTDTGSLLSVQLTSQTPFVYHDDEGKTVVIGEVVNTEEVSSVGDIKIKVNFYNDQNLNPVEIKRGTTILEVIPPKGTSPFIIESSKNSDITQAYVSVEGFSPSQKKERTLEIKPGEKLYGDIFQFSGTISNKAGVDAGKTNVFLVFYDSFAPPRIVGISKVTLDNVPAGESKEFSFDTDIPKKAVRFEVLAESVSFLSDRHTLKVPQTESRTKLATIADVSITDKFGKTLSEIKVGKPVLIQSNLWIQFSADQPSNVQPFVYYAQIKQSGEKPFVEFLGTHNGEFLGAERKTSSIEWVPQNKGVFFIETFVWDDKGIPIANKGPVILVIVT
ncbi:MAG: hypothetical protein GWN56_16370 [Nitrosopumilaceae archaeon]|nr:hypothetical protein [Nitrosopumilaceae archaeon]